MPYYSGPQFLDTFLTLLFLQYQPDCSVNNSREPFNVKCYWNSLQILKVLCDDEYLKKYATFITVTFYRSGK
jgi:hypothetical protein